MNKSILSSIAIIVGIFNWIAVISILVFTHIIRFNNISRVVTDNFGIYLKYSFLIAIISFVLSILIVKKLTIANSLVNITYLVIYILLYLIISYAQMGI